MVANELPNVPRGKRSVQIQQLAEEAATALALVAGERRALRLASPRRGQARNPFRSGSGWAAQEACRHAGQRAWSPTQALE